MTCISLTHDASHSHGINIYRDNLMPLFIYLFIIYGQAWSFTLGFDNSKCHLSRLQSESSIDEENLVTKQKEDQFVWVPIR